MGPGARCEHGEGTLDLVKALREGTPIVVTDDVLSQPGAAELVAGFDQLPLDVELNGVAGSVRVHRLRR